MEKRKTKIVNVLAKGIKMFLRKKKSKHENIVINAIKSVLKIKKRLVEYRKNFNITLKK